MSAHTFISGGPNFPLITGRSTQDGEGYRISKQDTSEEITIDISDVDTIIQDLKHFKIEHRKKRSKS